MTVTLPKWPAMTVQGESITREQAAEVLVRTNSWQHFSNDREWERTVADVLGVPYHKDNYPNIPWEAIQKVENDLGVLPLSYLYNSRVMSSWIGGPHGWLTWDGRVWSNNYNVGKWPSVQEVRDEWAMIAEAFPFLRLRCQLWAGETTQKELNGKPLVEFTVANGKVRVRMGQEQIYRPDTNIEFRMEAGSERGCSEKTLRWALEITRAKMEKLRPPPTAWDRLAAD